jgi:hypothetical protein
MDRAAGHPRFDRDDPSVRLVLKDKLWGVARTDGSWLIEPKFDQVDALSDGLARARLNGKTGFIDHSGQFVIPPVFDAARAFERGFPLTSAQEGDTFGVIDRTGTWVFRTDAKRLFLAVTYGKDRGPPFGWHFQNDSGWGLLDLDGRIILNAAFDQPIEGCADGRLVAYKNKEALYFKSDGTPLQPANGRLVNASCLGSEPPYVVKIGEKFGLVDAEGKSIAPATFDALIVAIRGAWNAEVGGKWGRIGPDGRWRLEPKFDYLSRNDPIMAASTDGKRGFLKSDGSWIIGPRFDAAVLRDADSAFVTIDDMTGVLKLKDQLCVVPPRPGVMCDVHYGIRWQSKERRAILSPQGESWVDIEAERMGVNLENGLLTFLKDGKWGLVDTAGDVMVQPAYDEPVVFNRGLASAKRDNHWCPIDRRGHYIERIACTDKRPTLIPNVFECKTEH